MYSSGIAHSFRSFIFQCCTVLELLALQVDPNWQKGLKSVFGGKKPLNGKISTLRYETIHGHHDSRIYAKVRGNP